MKECVLAEGEELVSNLLHFSNVAESSLAY